MPTLIPNPDLPTLPQTAEDLPHLAAEATFLSADTCTLSRTLRQVIMGVLQGVQVLVSCT